MRHSTTYFIAFAACLIALVSCPRAYAQTDAPVGEERAVVADDNGADAGAGREFRFNFGGGYTHRFATDLSEGDGDFSVSSLTGGLTVGTDINRDLSLDFRLNFGVSSYDFNGTAGLGGLDPWNDVQSLFFGMVAAFDISDEWSVFGGPVFQFSRESGADWSDGFTGGVIGGATYKFSDELVLGGGLGITSQIEDDVRIFPILILEWRFADHFRVSSRAASGGRTSIEFTGIELIWMPSDPWEFAVGAGSSYSRFRLDDDDDGGPADGVGQDESTPVWLRASFRPSENCMIDAVAGIGFGGELELDDEDGDSIASSDYDSPLFVGLFGSIKF